jgi:hypothetical protein
VLVDRTEFLAPDIPGPDMEKGGAAEGHKDANKSSDGKVRGINALTKNNHQKDNGDENEENRADPEP